MVLESFETDGGKLAVEIEGEGPLVVCCPGMGDHRDAFKPLATQLLQEGYKVAVMDHRGHGDSSTTFIRYGDEATADDFLLLVDRLGNGRAVLAGVSFAGGAATIAAGKRPDAIAGVILLGPFLRNPSDIAIKIMPILFWWPWGPTVWEFYAGTLWPGLSDGGTARAAESRALLTRTGHWPAFQNLVGSIDHREVGPWVEKASGVPALVVMGDKDPDWSKPQEEAEWVASNFRDHQLLMVAGAGHAPMLERPDLVGPSVIAFLAKLNKSGRF